MRVYLSSTFEDLVDYRAAAARALLRLGHQVVQMENYVSADTTPLSKVVKDVRACDAFVGIYAWKRGSIPQEVSQKDPPRVKEATLGKSSFTEWELAAALQAKLGLHLFLLHERAPWPPHFVDGFDNPEEHGPIRDLREKIRQTRLVSNFSTPEELEQLVSAAIANSETTRQLNLFLVRPVQFDNEQNFALEDSDRDSITKQIKIITSSIASSTTQRTVRIDLSTEWWSTRLFLLAFLAEHLTGIRRILITKPDHSIPEEPKVQFVGLLPTETVVSNLLMLHPSLQEFASQDPLPSIPAVDMEAVINATMERWFRAFDGKTSERNVKTNIDEPSLGRWFGHAMLRSPLEIADVERPTSLELALVMNYPHEFVPIAWEEYPQAETSDPPDTQNTPKVLQRYDVVEKAELSARISTRFVNDQLGRILPWGAL